jgi:hypothetical protein
MPSDALPSLIEAKAHSDTKQYHLKHRVLAEMMKRNPKAFVIDSDNGKGIVGITHVETGFRLHVPKQVLPVVLEKEATTLMSRMQSLRDPIANALERVKSLRIPGLSQAPLFGDDVAATAKSQGVTLATVGERIPSYGSGLLTRFLQGDKTKVLPYTAKAPKQPGVFVDFAGRGPDALKGKDFLGRRTKANEAIATAAGSSKAREAAEFPGLVPETIKLNEFAKSVGLRSNQHQKIHEALQKRFGQYIVKGDNSAATSADSIHTDLKGAANLRDYIKGYKAKDFVVQPRLDLQPLDRMGRAINQTAQAYWDGRLGQLKSLVSTDANKRQGARNLLRSMVGGKADSPMTYSLTGGKGKEYRVHVLDGKVVPYATSERGTLRGLIPWRTRNHRLAEQATMRKIEALPAAERAKLQGGYGFDVMKGKGKNQWHIVETNPSEVSGGSGFIADHPAIQGALSAAIKGQLPNYIKLQRGIEGTALAGTGLLGINALSGNTPDSVA